MSKFISFDAIKTNFDLAMASMGYVRIRDKCLEWGIKPSQYPAYLKKGYIKNEDSFTINNVKFISKNTIFEKVD